MVDLIQKIDFVISLADKLAMLVGFGVFHEQGPTVDEKSESGI
jgi:hypothetical protein